MIPTAEYNPKISEVRFEHTPNFAQVLEHLQVTLLVSTYQAGKLLAIGSHAGKLSFAFHGFDQREYTFRKKFPDFLAIFEPDLALITEAKKSSPTK